MMKNLLRIFLLAFGSLTILLQHSTSAQEQPNIVLIVSDDPAYQEISAYGGNLLPQPNMASIAGAGVLFRTAFATHSLCRPNRTPLRPGQLRYLRGHSENAYS